ncbi:MSMEG_1061 family FMN-dependent PPOX-type flavoprotein [Niveispirillum sp. KHB5.9]|uniref:MSMEG_1061 family FMN-dependent PPOX-type flavoprotein n=1 Tax=Niveispirillum sp. KHB5.9 TaxID=3400269 RepID=UPI003A85BB36
MDALTDEYWIDGAAELRALYGEPDELPIAKVLPRLDEHCRQFIAASPFLVLATHNGEGRCDASPRGDAPGFVDIIDDCHLFMADKPGNDRIDSLMNILRAPDIGMLFLIPGVRETLRINGTARITRSPELLARHAENGRTPKTGLVIAVRAAYLHCGRSLLKANLWNHETWPERKVVATAGRIWADHIALSKQIEETSR